MRKLLLLLGLLALVSSLVGCVSSGVSFSKENPNDFSALKWKPGAIDISGEKLSEKEYLIVAKGAGICTEEQVTEAWNEIADELAGGRVYESQHEINEHAYSASGGIITTQHTGIMVSGKIRILDTKAKGGSSS